MGKQTAVAMTEADEAAFLAYLRECGDIRVLEYFAPSTDTFEADAFEPRGEGRWTYLLWNTAFPFDFHYGQVTVAPASKRQGWYFIQDVSQGPFIEYARHNFQDEKGLTYGRIYWSKCRSRDGEFRYDVDEFGKWYSRVARWIRANGRQREKGPYNVYYLPDAWARHGDPLSQAKP